MSVLDRLGWLPWVRERCTRELADELQAHLEMAEADLVARGESPHEAAAHARRQFGNVGLVQEISRDHWGGAGMWLERFGQDARFALRMLRKAPGFTATAILTIAVGIGATTAIFSVVDATLLHPLPYPHPEQLVRIEDDLLGAGAQDVGMSTPEWKDLERTGVFQYVSPAWFDDNNLTGLAHAQRVPLEIVAPNYFALLGVKPQLGPGFDPADPTPGFNEQAVISDGLWTRAFGRDPNVLGRVVQLDSDSYRIVGVMPPGFRAPGRSRQERSADVWPAFGWAGPPLTEFARRSNHFAGAIARIKPGMTIAQAQSRIDVLVRTLRAQYPADYPPQAEWTVRLVPLKDNVLGDARQSLLFLLAAVALVLMIGCANVANLLLARAGVRSREMALRQALGGNAGRLVRQLLTESIVLSMLGGIAALVILFATKSYLVRLIPASLPRLGEITISWGVLGFAFGISMIAGAFFGLAPALHVRRLDVTRVLKQEGRNAAGSTQPARTRRLLVVGEFALSLVLMMSAALLLRSFWALAHQPLGFESRNVAIVHTRLPYPNEPTEDLYATAADEAPFAREVLRRVKELPGVEDAALGSSSAVPLDHGEQNQTVLRIVAEGHAGEQPAFIAGSVVTPEYFHLLGISLVRGRLLDEKDAANTPLVAVVNEATQKRFWPHESAIGKRIKLSPLAPAWTTIVGVVGDARTETLESSGTPVIYPSVYQRSTKHLAIFVRGRVASDLEEHVRAIVQSINAALPVFDTTTLDDIVQASLAGRRFAMEMLAAFALTALLLAGVGIYGVISYTVGQRAHEIGVRVALGALPADVSRLVLREGARLAVTGTAIGIGTALAVTRWLSGILYGIGPRDPLTFAGVTVLLTAIALVACYAPARRAAGVDPAIALRSSAS